MPDGMTPENNSYNQFKIGGPTRLPANEASHGAAKSEFKPVGDVNLPGASDQLEIARKFELTGAKEQLRASKEFPQPLMDVRASRGGDDEKVDPRAEHERRMAYLLGNGRGGAVEAIITRTKNLKDLKETVTNPKKEIDKNHERAEIAKEYVGMVHVFVSEIEEINKYLEDLKNPYPYDSRWTIQMAKDFLDKVNLALRERSSLDEEAKVILRMVKRDCLWLMSTARSMEAMGPSYETYFDGELEISQLRTSRTEILAGDHVRMFSRELMGLEIGDLNDENLENTETDKQRAERIENEKQIIKKLFEQLPEEFKKHDFNETSQKIERSFREEAIEVQDRVGDWGLKMVAAHQKNMEFGFEIDANGEPVDDPEMGENYAVIDEVTFKFLSKILNIGNAPGERYTEDLSGNPDHELTYIDHNGEKHIVPRVLLNPYCMDKTDEKAMQFFKAVFHVVVADKDLSKRLEDIKNGNPEDVDRLIKEDANKIIKKALWRVRHNEALNELGAYDRLIDVVIDSEINLERGTFASGDEGWGWKYEKVEMNDATGNITPAFEKVKKNYRHLLRIMDKKYFMKEKSLTKEQADRLFEDSFSKLIQGEDKNKFIVIRKSEKGSIYDNHDITTVYYGPSHIIEYDARAEDRGVYLFATVGWYRELWDYMPPYWKPEIAIFAKDDPELLRNLGVESNGDGNLHIEKGIETTLKGADLRKEYSPDYSGKQYKKFEKMNKKSAEFINENAWGLVTWTTREPGVIGTPNIVIPVFMPVSLPELNYWRTTSLNIPSGKNSGVYAANNGKIVDLSKNTIWHQRLRGKKYSEFDWNNIQRYRFNYHRVTLDQLERFYGPFVTAHMYNRATADQYTEFQDNPDGMAIAHKRNRKRNRLGLRMNPSSGEVFSSTVMSQMNAFASAREGGLYKISGVNQLQVNNQIQELRDLWVGAWTNTYLDMPNVVDHYGETCIASFIVTWSQLELAAASQRKMSIGQQGQMAISMSNALDKLHAKLTTSSPTNKEQAKTEETPFDGAEDETESIPEEELKS